MTRCSCGVATRDECESMHHAVIVKEAENYEYSKVHRLRADTYCMQHPDIHLVSAKSFAAHLLGMCIALEFGGKRRKHTVGEEE